ncbi:SMC-Scp complex subunit ScpB [Archaeoglobus veneficus]|uniref:Chromosome segregation and condensation protein, ScpB n=1 Tax=Archaeoglobus veneficus (strain DSM 11195 / SNP6) TaxID=693661 RepID=F2KNS3_ARCVS|nr:SMC-Scp complex subunit ScpB [Archaeoglobus veneficus]AEA47400.1 chromosome segregation and condensation protein, ScpB [Archaeoglobus veneficus SNP6]
MKRVIEAILFTSPDPLSPSRIARIAGADVKEVENALAELVEEYATKDSAIEVIEVGGKYLMRVKPEYHTYVERFAEKDMEKGVLRTLAVIALRQPIMLSKLAKIRGNKCYDHVKKLEEMGLIKAEKRGRTRILRTTKKFATYFGLKTGNPEEIREFLRKAAKEDSALEKYIEG